MIDFATETILSLAEAAAYVGQKRGRRLHVSVLYRWTTRGLRNSVLESIQVGGTRCTSVEALARFFSKLTHEEAGWSPPPRQGRRPLDSSAVLRKAGLLTEGPDAARNAGG